MELIQRLSGAIQHGRIRFPSEWEVLRAELEAFIYVTTPSGKVGAEAAATYHDDCVSAMLIMNEAFRYRPQRDVEDSGQYRSGGKASFDPRKAPRSAFSEAI